MVSKRQKKSNDMIEVESFAENPEQTDYNKNLKISTKKSSILKAKKGL